MASLNYNSANKINEEMHLKFDIKFEPTEDNSSNLTECADDTLERLSKGYSTKIFCGDSKVDVSYDTKLFENVDIIEKEENFKSANKINQEIPLKFEIKDEVADVNPLTLVECVDDTVENLFKDYGSEIVGKDSKVGVSYDAKLFENIDIIGKEENFKLAKKIKQEMPLKFEIKDELADDNLLNLTECANDTVGTLYNSDGSEICSENSTINSDHLSGNNAAECLAKSGEGKKNISVNYKKHKKAIEVKYFCDICNKSFTRSCDLKTHMRIHTGEKPYQCDVCNKCFSKSRILIIHKRIHNDEKPYQCDVCNKYFNTSGALNNHKRTHTGEKPYQCDVCNKCFSTSGSLNDHKRTHTGEKPYQCDVCKKCFSVSSHLIRHKRTHTGEKPHQCDICKKCFSESGKLYIHKRTHTGEKPYQCNVCNKFFSELGKLYIHKRTHTGEKPYMCDVCKKCFSVSSHLVNHKRKHTGEKPYQCDVCNKCFSESGKLNSHKRTHTGEKPYQCDICNKCYTLSSSLYSHKRLHTINKFIFDEKF